MTIKTKLLEISVLRFLVHLEISYIKHKGIECHRNVRSTRNT